MQAPPQAPQQTVKDQLGASLMGLPSVAPGGPQPGPQTGPQPGPQMGPQMELQPVPQPQQPPQQPPSGAPQAPMPQPRQAAPTPGMAGGGLTSIPLNMHHDFAAGGIIAFADGGYPSGYEVPEKRTIEDVRLEREAEEAKRGIGGDPYAEAKRRYAQLEAKQAEREKNAGLDRFWAGLAAYGSAGPRGLAQAAGNASKVMQGMQKEQEAESDTRLTKMAELQTLWAKEQDAVKRAALAADMGQVDKSNAAKIEALKLRQQFDQVKAQTISANASATSAGASVTSAAASTKQAETASQKEAREAEEQKLLTPARLALYKAQAAREGRPPPGIEETRLYMSDPKYAEAYDKMQASRAGSKNQLTYEDALKQAVAMVPGGSPKELAAAAHEILKYQNPNALSNPAAPPVGTIKGGYRFKGGDAGKQENWERV